MADEASTDPLNYLLEIAINPIWFKGKTQIVRILSVPATITFSDLSVCIQIAFQCNEEHHWDFSVRDCTKWTKSSERHADALLNILEKPYNMGFGPPEKYAEKTTLEQVVASPQFCDKIIKYEWDQRMHIITVKGRSEVTKTVKLISGIGTPPPREPPWISGGDLLPDTAKEAIKKELADFALSLGELDVEDANNKDSIASGDEDHGESVPAGEESDNNEADSVASKLDDVGDSVPAENEKVMLAGPHTVEATVANDLADTHQTPEHEVAAASSGVSRKRAHDSDEIDSGGEGSKRRTGLT